MEKNQSIVKKQQQQSLLDHNMNQQAIAHLVAGNGAISHSLPVSLPQSIFRQKSGKNAIYLPLPSIGKKTVSTLYAPAVGDLRYFFGSRIKELQLSFRDWKKLIKIPDLASVLSSPKGRLLKVAPVPGCMDLKKKSQGWVHFFGESFWGRDPIIL